MKKIFIALLFTATITLCSCDRAGSSGSSSSVRVCDNCAGYGRYTCPTCAGAGGQYFPDGSYRVCPSCAGNRAVTCPKCSGNGTY